VMELRVLPFADVAGLRLDRLADLEIAVVAIMRRKRRRREHVGRVKHRLAAQRPDPRLIARALVGPEALGATFSRHDALPASSFGSIRMIDARDGLQKALAFFVGSPAQRAAIDRDRFEQLDQFGELTRYPRTHSTITRINAISATPAPTLAMINVRRS